MQPLEVIKEGSKGIAVVKWQQFLIKQGLILSSVADGNFGPQTFEATTQFQQNNGLIPNGIVGNLTYAAAVNHGFIIALDIASYQGIDVYHGDGLVEWAGVKENPNLTIGFTYIKATQGTSFKDSSFDANRIHALLNGFKTGAYHYYLVNEPAEEQADHFLKVIGTLQEGEIPPAIDFEPTQISKSQIGSVALGLHTFLTKVEATLGVQPIIYTNYNSWVNVLGNPYNFNHYKLWVAEYAPSFPKMFGGWTEWALWQYTASGYVKGISHNHVDLNKYNQNSKLF